MSPGAPTRDGSTTARDGSPPGQSHRSRLLVLAFWIAPALVATLGFTLVPSRLRPDLGTLSILAVQLAVWMGWGLWSLLVFAAGARFPFERGRLLRAFAVHVPLGAVVVIAQIVVVSAVASLAGLREPMALASTLRVGIRQFGDFFTVVYCGIVVAGIALRWNAAYRDQQRQAARLEADLAHAQLRALQGQMQPHFLFNALNSIVSMVDTDPAGARHMAVRLADLLRATLRAGERQKIELRQEIELVEAYLDIERTRFSDRLSISWTLPDDLSLPVPPLALQPLVENAIRHGIARRAGPGHLAIDIARDGDVLRMSVTDDGPGLDTAPAQRRGRDASRGIGLPNLRARLERLYGAAASLELGPASGGGTVARVTLPA